MKSPWAIPNDPRITEQPPRAEPSPLWPCLSCGARNRLRDTTCRNCGDPKP